MKANHNYVVVRIHYLHVVVNISSSKNESKSQLWRGNPAQDQVVVNISSSKNESKSQLLAFIIPLAIRCCKYQ
ncbi:hypothetical protein SAMN05421813_1133 [Daejeonella rubra]|uniref:Uncharacterized protein n=1 Tax=Daejeonella rubra TaxID=990371 RepID=A0A1G9TFY9_9SPHI|nr:hypothetical protein SAMN05421813_1133 [Daejeonella rubra]